MIRGVNRLQEVSSGVYWEERATYIQTKHAIDNANNAIKVYRVTHSFIVPEHASDGTWNTVDFRNPLIGNCTDLGLRGL